MSSKKAAKKAPFPPKSHKALRDPVRMPYSYVRFDAYGFAVGCCQKLRNGRNEGILYKDLVTRLSRLKGKALIGYKKAYTAEHYGFKANEVIVTLEIPADAARYQPLNEKCRASRAKVLAVEYVSTRLSPQPTEARSDRDINFKYVVGEIVKPAQPFSRRKFEECASGIHFFLTKKEAIEYIM